MTPAARVAAAIEICDQIIQGQRTEIALTRWARASRFAGSKDRAAVRDLVYTARRRWLSAQAVSGGYTGRDILRGVLMQQDADLDALFGVGGHAPAALTDDERIIHATQTDAQSCDIPDWLWDYWCAQLGDRAHPVAQALREAAPVFVRVNLAQVTREQACASLADDAITAQLHPTVETALTISGRSGALSHCHAYKQGWIEPQDASSQFSATVLPRNSGGQILDYCAGGGGKSLALAAWTAGNVTAHDDNVARMASIPERAARAGHNIEIVETATDLSKFYDVVFCDVPCSGSGTWRRDPDGKHSLDRRKYDDILPLQAQILRAAQHHVAPNGQLIYATCSVFGDENLGQIHAFCSDYPQWHLRESHQFYPDAQGDGFFVARLTQVAG
jgi:16S rRNA (cytosine967-C5)-methyltransferase